MGTYTLLEKKFQELEVKERRIRDFYAIDKTSSVNRSQRHRFREVIDGDLAEPDEGSVSIRSIRRQQGLLKGRSWTQDISTTDRQDGSRIRSAPPTSKRDFRTASFDSSMSSPPEFFNDSSVSPTATFVHDVTSEAQRQVEIDFDRRATMLRMKVERDMLEGRASHDPTLDLPALFYTDPTKGRYPPGMRRRDGPRDVAASLGLRNLRSGSTIGGEEPWSPMSAASYRGSNAASPLISPQPSFARPHAAWSSKPSSPVPGSPVLHSPSPLPSPPATSGRAAAPPDLSSMYLSIVVPTPTPPPITLSMPHPATDLVGFAALISSARRVSSDPPDAARPPPLPFSPKSPSPSSPGPDTSPSLRLARQHSRVRFASDSPAPSPSSPPPSCASTSSPHSPPRQHSLLKQRPPSLPSSPLHEKPTPATATASHTSPPASPPAAASTASSPPSPTHAASSAGAQEGWRSADVVADCEGDDSRYDSKEFYQLTVKVEHTEPLAHWTFDCYVTHLGHPDQPLHVYRNVHVDENNLIVFNRSSTVLSPADDLEWIEKARDLLGQSLRIEVYATQPSRSRVVDSCVYFPAPPKSKPATAAAPLPSAAASNVRSPELAGRAASPPPPQPSTERATDLKASLDRMRRDIHTSLRQKQNALHHDMGKAAHALPVDHFANAALPKRPGSSALWQAPPVKPPSHMPRQQSLSKLSQLHWSAGGSFSKSGQPDPHLLLPTPSRVSTR